MHTALSGGWGMKYQFMPMFWGDFFANTLHLTAQELGAYVLLIGHAWEHGGKIPVADLQRVARVNNFHWTSVRARLEPFFRTSDVAPPMWHHGRVESELHRTGKLSNKNNKTTENLHPKTTAETPTTILELHLENLSNGKGREAPTVQVQPVPAPPQPPKPNLPPVNYRDPGNDYRSPPTPKSDLPPMTDEQRLAATLLAAKTESTPRKEPP